MQELRQHVREGSGADVSSGPGRRRRRPGPDEERQDHAPHPPQHRRR
jgi:hypothetical protein